MQLRDVMKNRETSQAQWIQFTILNKKLRDQGVDVKEHQYAKFKTFMLDAQQNGVIVIRNQGNHWEAKLA